MSYYVAPQFHPFIPHLAFQTQLATLQLQQQQHSEFQTLSYQSNDFGFGYQSHHQTNPQQSPFSFSISYPTPTPTEFNNHCDIVPSLPILPSPSQSPRSPINSPRSPLQSPRQSPRSPRNSSSSPRNSSSPRSPPSSSPRNPSSPRGATSPRKTDHTNDFGRRFQDLIHSNQKANHQWRKFRGENKKHCTIKRCIRLRLAFCEKYGHEFGILATSKCFRGLGTRSNCKCASHSFNTSSVSEPASPCMSPRSPVSMSPPSPSLIPRFGGNNNGVPSPVVCTSSSLSSSPSSSLVGNQSMWDESPEDSSVLPLHQAQVINYLSSGRSMRGIPFIPLLIT